MPKQETEELEARAAQREHSQHERNKRATFELLRKKPRAETEVVLELPGVNGDKQTISMQFRAIGAQAYDKLISNHPPTTEQKAEGAIYNTQTFGPALLSKVCIDPMLDYEQWREIWKSDDWNRGEIMQLFVAAAELCNRGLEIPKSDSD
jgi:hypothetical protein